MVVLCFPGLTYITYITSLVTCGGRGVHWEELTPLLLISDGGPSPMQWHPERPALLLLPLLLLLLLLLLQLPL